MDQYRQEHSANLSEVEQFLLQVSEAVIGANVDPTKLTAEEHQHVSTLQTMGSLVVMEANLSVFSGRIGQQRGLRLNQLGDVTNQFV